MNLIVYAEASAGTYPGHMVVGQVRAEGDSSFFGFRFDPADLPEEHRSIEKWRGYLSDHAVPGIIVDESLYVEQLLLANRGDYFEKRAACEIEIRSRIPAEEKWYPYAWYSFNPDDPHLKMQPCFNCVKWAIMVGNGLVKGFLPEVHQGRVTSVLKHLVERSRGPLEESS